jgi:biotin-dependent carboxylase-like uncharacterized protein
MSSLVVLDPGPLSTIQDLGRPGHADLGVGRSGACDGGALRLANRLVGNDEGAAVIEATAGGLAVRSAGSLTVAVTGAPCPVLISGRAADPYAPLWLPDGTDLRLGRPDGGLRSYLAVRGGLAVPAILGSRSTDLLSGIGPAPLTAGTTLPVGDFAVSNWEPVDVAPARPLPEDPLVLRVILGPRDDWFGADRCQTLLTATYRVSPESNRVGLRLAGPGLRPIVEGELPSEGLVIGALQVAPSGKPTLMLADHPVTGGYPVIAVVVSSDLDAAGQAWPGQRLRFRIAPPR